MVPQRNSSSARTVRVTLLRDGAMCAIPVPFDPKQAFGKARAPVSVTLNGFTYRSTIAPMGGSYLIPLRLSNREAAGLEGHETLDVTIASDDQPRTVTAPPDLRRALEQLPNGWERWKALSYTHQREHVEAIEEAKKPDTRARRVARAASMVAGRRPAR